MVDGICQAFEEMLAAQGIKATVKASLTSGLGPNKITAMNFTVASPPVRIGTIQLSGVSPAMQAKANALVTGQTGNEFDTENSAIGLQHAFEDLYQDQGYAAVQVEVTQIEPPVISGSGHRDSLFRRDQRRRTSTSSARSVIRLMRSCRVRKFTKSCRNIRPAREGRSIFIFWPSATPIMPGAISTAPSSRIPRSTRPRTS